MNDIIKKLQEVIEMLKNLGTNTQSDNGLILLISARMCIGIDVTPNDEIPDIVACVAQLQEVVRRARGRYIGSGAALYNTNALLKQLQSDSDFREVTLPIAGDIIVCATGTGNGSIPGHTGIIDTDKIMSNNSNNGLWETKYTLKTWADRYEKLGGFKSHYFRCN